MDLTVHTYAHSHRMEENVSKNVIFPSHYAAMLTGAVLQIKVCILWVEHVQHCGKFINQLQATWNFLFDTLKFDFTTPEINLISVGCIQIDIMYFSLSC